MKRIRYDVMCRYHGNNCRKEVSGYLIDKDIAMHHENGRGWLVDDLPSGCAICVHPHKDGALERLNEVLDSLNRIKEGEHYKRDVNLFGNTSVRIEELMTEEARKAMMKDDE